MQEANQQVTDVEFTETPKTVTPAAPEPFKPAVFLTKALIEAGHPEPQAWMKDIDPLVELHEEEKQRIFFANRALRLYLAEIEGRDNISPRMLLADGLDSVKWSALMTQGVVPWLMNQFDEKTGKRKKEVTAHAADPEVKQYDDTLDLSDDEKSQVRSLMKGELEVPSLELGDKTFWRAHRNGALCGEWNFTAEPNVRYVLPFTEYVVVGLDEAAPGTSDQTVETPAKKVMNEFFRGQEPESTDEATPQTPAQGDAGDGDDARPSSSEA